MAGKRKCLSLKEKIEIIEESEKTGLSTRKLAEKFKVGKTQVTMLLQNKAEVRNLFQEGGNGEQKRKFPKTEGLAVDQVVFNWFCKARNKHLPISGPIIQAKALESAQCLGLDSGSPLQEIENNITITNALIWVSVAWRNLSEMTIKKCFMKAGFMCNADIDDFEEEDNIPLAQLFPTVKDTFVNLKQFASIDSDLPTESAELTIIDCIEEIQETDNTTPNSETEEEEPDIVPVSNISSLSEACATLLSGTLRTYQRAGCDNDIVTLKCPAGTSIAVQIAQYGKSASSKGLCSKLTSTTTSLDPDIFDTTVCLLPNTIQTVVEACQKKRQCKFQTSPTTFGGDPCPGIPKYVEVAYKCRPYEFRSKVACENERIQLKCNPNSRVAVYSASYGRTQYESIQCPQPQGVPEETCLASYATETVMQLCHGKRNCDLAADISTFGSPCKPQSRMYLKVVYTCVPRRVLKDQYEGQLESDETDYDPNDGYEEFDTYEAENEHIRESAASPPVSKFNISKDNNTKDADAGVLSKDKSDGLQFEIYQHYIIYIIISVIVVFVVLASLLVGRIVVKRHRTQKDATFYTTSISDHTLANGFTDDISEVDADIDLQTTLPMSMPSVTIHPVPMGTIAEVVRYPEYPEYPHMHSHSHTFRALPGPVLESDVIPTRPMRDVGTSQYYYG